MDLWIWCENCGKTQPLAGGKIPDLAVNGWTDLCCSHCAFVIATISRSDGSGHRPEGCVA
jgi:hypothetical protein